MDKWNIDEAADLYVNQRLTYQELSLKYGRHYSTIWQLLKDHPKIKEFNAKRKARRQEEAKPKGSFRPRQLATESQMQRWLEGDTITTLASEAGLSHSTMRNAIVNHPSYAKFLEMRANVVVKTKKTSRDRIEDIGRRFSNKESMASLSERFGISRQRVYQIIKDYHPEILENHKAFRNQALESHRAEKAANKAQRDQAKNDMNTAVELYRQGFVVREILKLYPDIGKSSFVARLTRERDADPTFPAERGRGGANYNWTDRTLAALKVTKTYAEAAKLTNTQYGTFVQRVNKLRSRGYNV